MSSSDRSNVPAHVAQQVEDLGLHGDVERGRRFVGDEQRRLGRERERDHRALAQAAAQLMRVLAGAARRVGHAHGVEQFDRARARRRAAREPVHAAASPRSGSRSCRPGSSATIGSWNTKPMRRPRTRRMSLVVEVQQVAALELDAAAGDASGRHDEPDDRQRGHRLAAAGFADEPERFAAADRERHVVDGRGLAAVREREHRAEALDARARRAASGVDVTVFAEHAAQRVGDFAERRARFDRRDDGRHEVRCRRARRRSTASSARRQAAASRRCAHAPRPTRPGAARPPDRSAAARSSPARRSRNRLTPTMTVSPRSMACCVA